MGPAYFAACEEWDALLVAALHAHPWPEKTHSGVREGFDSIAQILSGLGDPEPPRPELNQPECRWGLAPQTSLTFEGGSLPLRFEACLQSPDSDQSISVQLDGKMLTHLALIRINDSYTLNLDFGVLPGHHELTISYAKAIQPPSPDPRTLEVQFLALRIRET